MNREDYYYYFLTSTCDKRKKKWLHELVTQTLQRKFFSPKHEMILEMSGSKGDLWNFFCPQQRFVMGGGRRLPYSQRPFFLAQEMTVLFWHF